MREQLRREAEHGGLEGSHGRELGLVPQQEEVDGRVWGISSGYGIRGRIAKI